MPDFAPLVNKLSFGPLSYLYSVYQLESLRMAANSSMVTKLFLYLEDKAVQRDKNGELIENNSNSYAIFSS